MKVFWGKKVLLNTPSVCNLSSMHCTGNTKIAASWIKMDVSLFGGYSHVKTGSPCSYCCWLPSTLGQAQPCWILLDSSINGKAALLLSTWRSSSVTQRFRHFFCYRMKLQTRLLFFSYFLGRACAISFCSPAQQSSSGVALISEGLIWSSNL